jgi:threonylcarbamoyladenosine tRNA methylthiotransferase MtaB
MARFASHTLGCKANQFDTFTVEDQLMQLGYQKVAPHQNPDLLIINTCSVTHIAERKSRFEIRHAKRENPHSKIIVMGCYAELEKENLKTIMPEIDLVISQKEKLQVGDWALITPQNTGALDLLDSKIPVRFNLRIQDGCQLMCHYCSIPFSRGKHQSTPLDEVLNLANRLVHAGASELVLTGINIGAYGVDLKNSDNLIQVIQSLAKIQHLKRIRISSIELRYLTDNLLEAWFAEPKMCKHFHIPLQAGHTQTLQAMNRKYTLEDYANTLQKIRSINPNAAINTDIMPGFPGETDSIWEESLQNIRALNFSRIHVFPYSKRRNTPAFDRTDHIAPEIINARVDQLLQLGREHQALYAQQYLGKPLQVLIEEKLDDGTLTGFSENYIRCVLPEGSGQLGEIVDFVANSIEPKSLVLE